MRHVCEKCLDPEPLDQLKADWARDLTETNIQLMKKVHEKETEIHMLNRTLLKKKHDFWNQTLDTLMQQLNDMVENRAFKDERALVNTMMDKMDEISKTISLFKIETRVFENHMALNEKVWSERLEFTRDKMVYFRNKFLEQMQITRLIGTKSNEEAELRISDAEKKFRTNLEDQNRRVREDVHTRYQRAMRKCQQELELQAKYVVKMKNQNRQLYVRIQKIKRQNERYIEKLKREIARLRGTPQASTSSGARPIIIKRDFSDYSDSDDDSSN